MVTEAQKASMKRWYYAHRQEKIAKVKEWYEKNRKKVSARNKAKYITRPKVMRARVASWYSRNKDKVRAYRKSEHYRNLSRKWWNSQPEIRKLNWLKFKHGLTPQQFEEMLKSQDGCCAICGNGNNHPTRWGKNSIRLTVDHCHTTGKIRGLLCHKCNAGLGFFQDRTEVLKKAVAYLAAHGS